MYGGSVCHVQIIFQIIDESQWLVLPESAYDVVIRKCLKTNQIQYVPCFVTFKVNSFLY